MVFVVGYWTDAAGHYADTFGEYMSLFSGYITDSILFLDSDRMGIQTIGGVYLYTTYLTSLLLWLMTPVLLAMRIFSAGVGVGGPLLDRYLDLEKHFFLVMGGITILLFSAAYWILGMFLGG